MATVRYWEDNPQRGIKIDWHFIMNEYYKLVKKVCGNHIENFYMPSPPWESARFFIDLSERSIGKTTNYLIIGALLFREYGIRTEYIRLTKDGIMPKNANTLFDVMRQFGYIRDIFKGQYNDVVYASRAWYFVLNDENGKEINRSEQFVHMHSLESTEVDNEKSVYNSPRGDYIIIDEFIPVSGINTEQQFLNMIQLHSTIRRQRECVTILLANVINQYCHWFAEFGINDDIARLHKGGERLCKSSLGVDIWLHYASFDVQKISEKRLQNNLRYYGFGNPKLNSVTGCGEWQTKIYPHLPAEVREHPRHKIEIPRIVFYLNEKPMLWEVWESELIGLYAFVRPYYDTPGSDAILCKLQQPMKYNEVFGLPLNRFSKLIEVLLYNKRTFYSHNDIGSRFEEYMLQYKSLIGKL